MTAFCLTLQAKDASFSSFLTEFKYFKDAEISIESFGPKTFNERLDNAYVKFLPLMPNDCNCDDNNLAWQAGSYTKKDNHVVAFMQRFNFDCKDGYEKLFMEHMVCEYVMVVYSEGGAIVDRKVLGKNSFIHFTRVSGNLASGIVTEQGNVNDLRLLKTYDDLTYTVSRHTFKVNSSGKIDEKVSKTWQETKSQTQNISSKDVSFSSYLKYFEKWDKPYFDNTLFNYRENSELPLSMVNAFLSPLRECDCKPKGLTWRAYHYFDRGNNLILFIARMCDFPIKEGPQYSERIVLTYDKTGKMIDYKVLGKMSDEDNVEIERSDNNHLKVKTYKTESNNKAGNQKVYFIDADGNIR